MNGLAPDFVFTLMDKFLADFTHYRNNDLVKDVVSLNIKICRSRCNAKPYKLVSKR